MKQTTLLILLSALLSSCHYQQFKSHCSNPTALVLLITSGSSLNINKIEPDSSNVDSVSIVYKYQLKPSFSKLLRTDTFKVQPFVKQKSIYLPATYPDLLIGDYLIVLYPSRRQYKLTDITTHSASKWVSNYEYGSSYAECTNGLSIKVNDSTYSHDWRVWKSEPTVFWIKY